MLTVSGLISGDVLISSRVPFESSRLKPEEVVTPLILFTTREDLMQLERRCETLFYDFFPVADETLPVNNQCSRN